MPLSVSRCLTTLRPYLPHPWLLLYSIPPLLTFWAILNYGVDTIYGDELLYLSRLLKIATDTFQWSDLIALHYDHRPTLPFLITAASVFTVGWHAPYKFFFSLAFALASAYLLQRLLQRTHPALPLLTRRLLTLLFFTLTTSLLQYDIWFQGMFLSLPLLMLCYLTALYWLTIKQVAWPALAFATLCCLAATLTLHQGILTFFALLPLLISSSITHRPRKLTFLVLVGLVVVLLYHANYTDSRSGHKLLHLLDHPLDFLQFLVTFWGAPLAPSTPIVAASAGTILLLAAASLSAYFLVQPRYRQAALPWISLLVFVLLLSLATALGRSYFGPHYALRPRYLAMSAFGLAATLPLLAAYLKARTARIQLFHAFLGLVITSQIILGFLFLPRWHQKSQSLRAGQQCLAAYQTAPPACLSKLSDGAMPPGRLTIYVQRLEQLGLLNKLVR